MSKFRFSFALKKKWFVLSKSNDEYPRWLIAKKNRVVWSLNYFRLVLSAVNHFLFRFKLAICCNFQPIQFTVQQNMKLGKKNWEISIIKYGTFLDAACFFDQGSNFFNVYFKQREFSITTRSKTFIRQKCTNFRSSKENNFINFYCRLFPVFLRNVARSLEDFATSEIKQDVFSFSADLTIKFLSSPKNQPEWKFHLCYLFSSGEQIEL